MKVAVALVDGFEIVEATAPIDMLRRAGVEVDLISVFDTETVTSAQKVEIVVDKKFSDVDINSYGMLILPGGAGTAKYYDRKELLDAVQNFVEKDKYLGAICAAPSVFAKQGILEGKNAISFPTFQEVLKDNKVKVVNTKVVVDGKIITARSAAASIEFGLELVEKILGKEKRQEIETAIVY